MAASQYINTHADLTKSKALPNGAATVATDGIQLHNEASGEFHVDCEIEIAAPVLTTAELPDAQTMIYDIYHDDASDFSGEVLLASAVITQTGAGGAGDAAETQIYKPHTATKRHIRVKATNSGAGNASAKSVTVTVKLPVKA